MNRWCYYFGGVASLALHGVVLGLLALGSCESQPTDAPTGDVASAETNVVASAEQPAIPRQEPPTDRVKPTRTPTERPTSTAAHGTHETRETREWKTYVVKRGDKLSVLAKNAGCTVDEIAKRNNKSVAQMAKLWVGQKIFLPIPVCNPERNMR